MENIEKSEVEFIMLSPKARDITGQRYGRLVAVGPVGRTHRGRILWLCRCDCGGSRVADQHRLWHDNIQSCGCLRAEQGWKKIELHGKSKTRVYQCWRGMIVRCTYAAIDDYKHYGGRGIDVYSEWRESFEAFESYVSRLPHYGERGYSLDRIDNNGNSEPGNVRWATKTEQNRNTRRNQQNAR